MIASTVLRYLCDEIHWSFAGIMRKGDGHVLVRTMMLRKATKLVPDSTSYDSTSKHDRG